MHPTAMRADAAPNTQVLAALTAISETTTDAATTIFLEALNHQGEYQAAGHDQVVTGLQAVMRRVRLASIPVAEKAPLLDALQAVFDDPPPVSLAEIRAWRQVAVSSKLRIVTLARPPVALPSMPQQQEAAWGVLLDMDEKLNDPWCLVGGQMVLLHCVENGYAVQRPTDDGDVVLGVWTHRDALLHASALLREANFAETATDDGYGYRYTNGSASIDLLLPEEMERQDHRPTTVSGRTGLPIPGGNQALIRAERVPVMLGQRHGHVRRPNLLGALVAKAAAAVADRRDTGRHHDDLAVLGQIALNTGQFRGMSREANPNDRRRLRLALAALPLGDRSWRLIADAEPVHSSLILLGEGP